MQEDHVSLGWHAARKLRRGLDALARVIAIEVLTAARGLDLRVATGLAPATGTDAVRRVVREHVAGPGPDRHLAPEIKAVVRLVRSGALARAAADAVGPLR